MFVLEDEPEKGHRLKWYVLGTVIAFAFQGGGLFAAKSIQPKKLKKQVLIEAIYIKPKPKPKVKPPPPPPPEVKPKPLPEVKPEPKPKPKKLKPKPRPKKPKPKKPKPKPKPKPQAKAPTKEPPKKPVPLVTGINMNSTTAKGPGPVVQVGNTQMGTVSKRAKKAQTGQAPKGPKTVVSDTVAAPKHVPVRKRARLRKKVSTKYTKAALRANVEGKVVVVITIDKRGHVTDVKVIKGLGFGLDEKAVEAVRKWTYSPATIDGVPTPTKKRVSVDFRIED